MDEGKFIDAESYQGSGKNDALTFRDIVMRQLQKISQNANVEFRGGFWNETTIPHPNMRITKKEYIPDSREVYSNSIEYLLDILYPHADKELLKVFDESEKDLDEAYLLTLKEFGGGEQVKERIKKYFDDDTKKYMAYCVKFKIMNGDTHKVKFRELRRKIIRKLFVGINQFLKRNNYLEGKQFEDSM